jgi:solute carrier family 35 (UDP-sugar transporter), member A1/2/3
VGRVPSRPWRRVVVFFFFSFVRRAAALSLSLFFSRPLIPIHPTHLPLQHSTRPGTPYLASVAVVLTETIKLALCAVAHAVAAAKAAPGHGRSAAAEARRQAREVLGTSPPMLVPASLFVAQQVLVIVAASHLDAVTFQICSQSFKIVPTAFFAVWLLGQHLEPHQWASLPVLAAGTIFVTLNGSAPPSPAVAAAAAVSTESASHNLALGLAASALSGLSSAYAGVHFEKFVKGRASQSLWVRNLQLSVYGAPLALAYALARDGGAIRTGGFLQGFGPLAWAVVGLQVFGGLIVGLVVKYADNILKNFANAASVVLTVLGAIPLFGMWPSAWFLAGVGAVLLSVSMYSGAGPGLPGPVAAALAAAAKAYPGLAAAAGDVATALGLAKPASGSHAHAPAGAARRAARIRVAAGLAAGVALVAGAGAVSHSVAGSGGGDDRASPAAVGAALGRRAGFGSAAAGMPVRRPADASVRRPDVVPGDSDGDLSRSAPVDGDGGGGRRRRSTLAADALLTSSTAGLRHRAEAVWASVRGGGRRRG